MATAEIITPGSALALLPNYKPAELFAPGFIDPLIDRIKAEVRSIPTDISTDKGRKDLASLAHKIARSKTFIDQQRLALVSDEKKRLKAIDVEGARIWDELEALQAEVRKPLTDWENAEQERIEAHENLLAQFLLLSTLPGLYTVSDAKGRIAAVETLFLRDWQEFAFRAKAGREASIMSLTRSLDAAEKAEADRVELERLRAEQAIRDQQERDERIAREAREKAEAAARGREAQAARDAEAERQRVETEKFQAEARAKQAESQRIADAERAEQARIAAERKAEADKIAAVEAERQRVETMARKTREETETRERNKAHTAKINREVRDAIVACGATEDVAVAIVKALALGSIPYTRISY